MKSKLELLFLYTSCLAYICAPSHAQAGAASDLQKLQKPYLSKEKVSLEFEQKSYFADFDEPMVAKGVARVNRKEKSFTWRIEEPSLFVFSADSEKVQMKTAGGGKQVFLLKDLPEKFKFIQIFFEVLGFEKISEKSWAVKKEGSRKFSLKSLKKKMPIKELHIELTKKGTPYRVKFKNESGTRFEIKFKEGSLKRQKKK